MCLTTFTLADDKDDCLAECKDEFDACERARENESRMSRSRKEKAQPKDGFWTFIRAPFCVNAPYWIDYMHISLGFVVLTCLDMTSQIYFTLYYIKIFAYIYIVLTSYQTGFCGTTVPSHLDSCWQRRLFGWVQRRFWRMWERKRERGHSGQIVQFPQEFMQNGAGCVQEPMWNGGFIINN